LPRSGAGGGGGGGGGGAGQASVDRITDPSGQVCVAGGGGGGGGGGGAGSATAFGGGDQLARSVKPKVRGSARKVEKICRPPG
jgi:hypothetical protein